jgi:hypothetical protein
MYLTVCNPCIFISTSASSTNSALDNYEVEVVEIRATEKDLDSRKEVRYEWGFLVAVLFVGQSQPLESKAAQRPGRFEDVRHR